MEQDWISEVDPDENLGLGLWEARPLTDVVPIMDKHTALAKRIEEKVQPMFVSDRPVATLVADPSVSKSAAPTRS